MKLKIAFIWGFVFATISQASFSSCIWSEGYYKNDAGNVEFVFYNTCNKSFPINLCVQEYVSPTSDEIKFRALSGMIRGRDILKISAGPWNDWIDYRWDWGQEVACPYRAD